jgi:hypothetical protein
MENKYRCIKDYYYNDDRRTFTRTQVYHRIDSGCELYSFIDDEGDQWSFVEETIKIYFTTIKFKYGK